MELDRFATHVDIESMLQLIKASPTPAPPAAVVNVQGVRRDSNTARRCLIDNCNYGSLRQVPNSVKVQLLSYYYFYVPNHACICQWHLIHMAIEEIPENIINQMTDLNAESVGDIINLYTQALEQRSNFNVDDVSDEGAFGLEETEPHSTIC
ncbi:unnamed protein product [Parnassius apollo]|uniref:(apollo) hypothetical protein n=1 Tax=Parnassius apollo TaxID=110799 RepID=A0A8S3WFR1_PARAO|nr:unnamed protein product [Parnassius apollo]